MKTGAVEGYAVHVTYKTHHQTTQVTGTAYPSTAPVFIPGFYDDVSCK
jgi:hypothetical protein